jgi:glycosyltransferase involved in cell wall biosynthesis
MVFTNLGSAIPRKNQHKLIQAFHQAFGHSPDVKLRINCRFGNKQVIQDIQSEIDKLGMTTVEFSIGELNADAYFKTLQDTDCYVNISSGEGFSIQPRQAMALGIPTITTDNTAQSTICQSALGLVVPSSHAIPAFYPDLQNCYGSFYDCTVEDVAIALRNMYDNYDHYLEQKEAARAWASKYSYKHLKSLYIGIIVPKKIILGNMNRITPDCLFVDSAPLCEKFNALLGTPWETE